MNLHGWLILDKPVGIGSTPCVSAVKRALRQGGYGKVRVGHGGTLDPLASGVLPIALGEATKLAGRMLDADKLYDFTIRFGVATDTLDAEGQAVASSPVRPTGETIAAVLPGFTGPIEQVPPAYSAIKVDGERAYDRARAGETVEMRTRAVTVYGLSPFPRESGDPAIAPEGSGAPAFAGEGLNAITLRTHVSKGTYIRSLARDIAVACGTVGHVTYLRRLKAGPFTLAPAISLDKLAELATTQALEQSVLPLTAGLDDIPALPVTPDQAGALRQGRRPIGIAAAQGLHLATENDVPVALVEVSGPETRVVRGFNL